MTVYIRLLLLSILFSCKTLVPSSRNNMNEEYKLVWSDEFEQDGRPNSANWDYEHGFVRNHEAQWYQPANAFCENGLLVIEARKEKVENPKYNPSFNGWREKRAFAHYTSASLLTKGLHSWTYGRFEMRAKIDVRSGMWPAFWTLGVDGEWPVGGEVDIMEYYRGNILANVAWASETRWKPIWDSEKKSISTFDDSAWADKFHTWRMDWTKDYIRLYVDDELINETDLANTINQRGKIKNPFHRPQYILLCLALGGDNGGDLSQTSFPARFEIDYVRVYQKP